MNNPKFRLKAKQEETILVLGELILGVKSSELGKEYIEEANLFISNLEDFLISDLNRLLNLFNSRITVFFTILKFKPFVKLEKQKREKYFDKWVKSKFPLLRTGASTLRALCGWSYYSLEKSWKDMDYPGRTLGREDKTPTLLEGKEPWTEGMEVA